MKDINNNVLKTSSFFSVLLISCYLLYICINIFYISTTSPSDENQFQDLPSKYIISKKILVSIDDGALQNKYFDTLQPGQFLISISDINLNTSSENPIEIIESLPQESLIPVKIYDFKSNLVYKYFLNKNKVPEDFYTYLSSSAIVTAVVKDGASDRAGIKLGDVIVEINGSTFENVLVADQIMRNAQSDKLVKYKIFRNNEYKDFNVQLAKFGVKFSILNTFVIGLLILLFGLILFIFKFKFTGAKLLGLSFILMGFNYGTANGMVENYYFDSFLRFLPVYAFTFGIAIYFHSLMYFPFRKEKILKRKFPVYIYYLVALFLTIYYSITIYKNIKIYIDYHVLTILINIILHAIFVKVIENDKSEIHKRMKFPLKVMLISYLAILICMIILNIFLIQKININNIQLIGDIVNSLFVLFPITHLYIILKNNLFDISFRIRRNIKYLIFSIIFKIMIFIAFIFLNWMIVHIQFSIPNINVTGNSIEMLNTPIDIKLHEIYLRFIISVVIVINFIIFIKLYKKLRIFIDKKFYRTSYDYRKATTDFSNILAKQVNLDELVLNVTNILSEILNIKRLGIIIFKNDSRIQSMHFNGVISNELKEFCSASANNIYQNLINLNKEVNISLLPDPIDKVLKGFKFQYIYPIKSKTKVFGFILLSEKMSETQFVTEDFDFISSISGQLSVAIENGILYENLAEQERIKHELEIARKIQLASLPQSDPQISGLDIVGMSLPALEVGGDFYDYLYTSDDEITIVVGDVSGKGTSAALYMSKTQGIIRTLYEFEQSPKNLLIRTNQLIHKYLEKNYFISAISVFFNSKQNQVTLARAGHLPLYYFNSKTNDVEKITPKGMMLGLKKERLFERNIEEISLNYNIGDIFVLVTDGVTESRNRLLQEFGEDNLIETIRKNSSKSAVDLKNSILVSLQKFTSDEIQNDDLTLIVIKA